MEYNNTLVYIVDRAIEGALEGVRGVAELLEWAFKRVRRVLSSRVTLRAVLSSPVTVEVTSSCKERKAEDLKGFTLGKKSRLRSDVSINQGILLFSLGVTRKSALVNVLQKWGWKESLYGYMSCSRLSFPFVKGGGLFK